MKRKTALFLVLVTVFTFCLSSCGSFLFGLGKCDVTYNFGGAAEDVTVSVDTYSYAVEPKVPDFPGYVFDGWFLDPAFTQPYDFSEYVTADITLYIRWREADMRVQTDYEAIINSITREKIRATVMFSVEKYDVGGIFGATKLNVSRATGSGVIFAEKDGYYYCLTNNHVVAKGAKAYADISVVDYQSETYSAELIASDAGYDLALVRFKKNITEPLAVLSFQETRPLVDETVIAIGSPGGQQNAITFGDVLKYDFVTIDDASTAESNVTFSVLWHDAPMDNGSSGGVLLDLNLNIVGINYAAATQDGKFVYGFAVTSDKIQEFLSKNNFEF